jgi:hypothetical protein
MAAAIAHDIGAAQNELAALDCIVIEWNDRAYDLSYSETKQELLPGFANPYLFEGQLPARWFACVPNRVCGFNA